MLNSKYFSSTVKSIIVHFVVLILAYGFVIYPDNYRYFKSNLAIYNNIIIVIFFYVHSFLLLPIVIEKKNLKRYLLFIIICFIIINTIESWFGALHSSMVTRFEDGTKPSPFLDFFLRKDWIIGHMLTLLPKFSTVGLISFVYGYFILKIKSQESLFNLKLGAKESELQLLKSQVNPHFLFNTLNTLYATALEENAPKTAESTAKLANLIRYMQEDIDKDFIPLENEIKYLQDYIIIQKLRCAIKPEIETKFENIAEKVISPGLFIPFVENAFKHGIDPSKPSKLFVSVICDENTIHFECVNSFDVNYKTYYKEQGFGIGIKNAKQRLKLVYPQKHSFEVEKENNTFSVKLSIKTN